MAAALWELLARGRVWYNIGGEGPRDVIGSAVDALSEDTQLFSPESSGASDLTASILERERLSSTAMGEGLAFPHPRLPFFKKAEEAFLALFYPRFPIFWGAPDGKPVSAFFILASSNATIHLSVLSALSKRCSDPEFKALLDDQAGLKALMECLTAVS